MKTNSEFRGVLFFCVLTLGLFNLGCSGPDSKGEKALNPGQQSSVAESEMALPDLVKLVKADIMVIEAFDGKGKKQGVGTGFMVSEAGWGVTNYHVLKYAKKAKVTRNGKSYQIDSFPHADPKSDLLVFQIESLGGKVKGLSLADKPPQIGEKVVAIGNPLGLEISVSDGIVAALREYGEFGSVLQITSPISPGSSGSPVFNDKGQVVGVATFQMTEGQNLNFAIPVDRVRRLLAKAQGGKEQSVESENISPFDEGWDFFDEKDYSRAATAFQEAVERDAQDGEAHYYLALCYRELGDFRAVSEMERALALDGELENGHYELGVTYKMLNVKNKAEEQFLEELIGNPDHENSAIHLAEIYAERKDYPGVIGLLKKHRAGTRNCDLLTLLGYAYYETGEYGQAIFAFKEAVDYDSSHIRASLGLAATFIEVENWSQGIKVMSDIMLLEPDNPMIHYLLGVLRAGDGDIESARREKEILRGLGDEGNKLSNELSRLISRIERR